MILRKLASNDQLEGQINMNKEDFFQAAPSASIRGHSLKLAKPTAQSRVRSNFWSVRTINDWNSLPDHIVQAQSTNEFKNLLDDHWSSHAFDIP